MTQSNAQFTIDLTPGEPLHAGTGRFDFTKSWTGDLIGHRAARRDPRHRRPRRVEGVHKVVLHHNL